MGESHRLYERGGDLLRKAGKNVEGAPQRVFLFFFIFIIISSRAHGLMKMKMKKKRKRGIRPRVILRILLAAPFCPATLPAVLSINKCIKSGLALCGGLPTWWRTKVDSGAPSGVFGDVRDPAPCRKNLRTFSPLMCPT